MTGRSAMEASNHGTVGRGRRSRPRLAHRTHRSPSLLALTQIARTGLTVPSRGEQVLSAALSYSRRREDHRAPLKRLQIRPDERFDRDHWAVGRGGIALHWQGNGSDSRAGVLLALGRTRCTEADLDFGDA